MRYWKTLRWVKLSNSGEPLKLMVPNYIRKAISGWINYSCMVISHKIDEKKMGNRGSKSDFSLSLPYLYSLLFKGRVRGTGSGQLKSVKEQRVDGSWCNNSKLMRLRCTLMGFERNYQIKIHSKQLNKSNFSTLNCKPGLNPWFITGFTDAEGCFSVSVKPDAKLKTKWRVSPLFIIQLHLKDLAILEEIKNTLSRHPFGEGDVGKIRKNGKNMCQYVVESFKDLQVIVDHFDKYTLITAKVSDYLIFKQCFEMIKQGEHLTEKGVLKIVSFKSSLNWGLSDNLKKAFPNVKPVNRPEYLFKGITEPFWVAGFTSGEGSFNLIIRAPETKKSSSVSLRFSLNLHIREKEVIKGLATFFKLYETKVYLVSDKTTYVKYSNIFILEKSVGLQISKISDIVNTIIPFFEKYHLVGIKSFDFADFKKVAYMVKNKEHLSPEGLNKILEIKSTMNQNRCW
uniref:Homing endonuclease LAGLIDADG domain-containing protein n=1 Tax=Hypsizygus marmoreus TaxID=39966 RepID=A0A4V1DVG1_HYPMA|nr:hypothetical protein HM01MITGene33 [Hypsizygus marmoreus]QBZ73692.1 hypothetical protein HM01MITGene33 [Hypsizygus marmoreus]QCI56449.1 hypothetical protein [Hypsizygus marmoreus]